MEETLEHSWNLFELGLLNVKLGVRIAESTKHGHLVFFGIGYICLCSISRATYPMSKHPRTTQRIYTQSAPCSCWLLCSLCCFKAFIVSWNSRVNVECSLSDAYYDCTIRTCVHPWVSLKGFKGSLLQNGHQWFWVGILILECVAQYWILTLRLILLLEVLQRVVQGVIFFLAKPGWFDFATSSCCWFSPLIWKPFKLYAVV